MQERAQATRAAVLRAAAEVFEEYGYAQANIARILDVAGVTKGALYFHFDSKLALARAVIHEQRLYARESAEEHSALQTLIDVSHDYARALETDVMARAAVRLSIEHGSFTEPDVGPYDMWTEFAVPKLEEARASGDLHAGVESAAIAEILVGAFTGIQLYLHVRANRVGLDRRITDLWALLLPGLVPGERLARFEPRGTESVRVPDRERLRPPRAPRR